MGPWTERQLRFVGSPTTAHAARYKLWCWLWCRDSCNNLPSGADNATSTMEE